MRNSQILMRTSDVIVMCRNMLCHCTAQAYFREKKTEILANLEKHGAVVVRGFDLTKVCVLRVLCVCVGGGWSFFCTFCVRLCCSRRVNKGDSAE